MIDETNFETFVYISKNKYQIFVFDKKNLENLYLEELNTYKYDFEDLSNFSKFLDKNIYKIEKLVGTFIKNIILIIENDNNLNVNISLKKKFYDNSVNQRYLESNLTEIKDLFLENYQNQTIMHMMVTNYIINEKKYSKFKNDLLINNLGLEVNFIAISNDLVFLIDKILEKYQIKISQYMCGNYIRNFFNDDRSEISLMAHKLRNGYNDNEVVLIPKNKVNKGFFEKFFQLFS
tara:strand:- start:15 stop:716 length:702 start_codon:yes stop_codon:yes gene_type:complete